ncbi:efflux RND transporter periplasmic adaptor subunit [Roseisolibacter sp. H3M3-2]|uniref:efflux RND transporter periplasmic adaptor subunit n=1 Tax=Roseisolibacter sp. H3M3-2 TaxID=3031323 RepID=UPI0023DC2C90|nr:efflux RND transporter periplasmic adaptor subunit [Roseisolibacter sp. H3M3-2]MDF1503763.1 efflux RND transporter periplasmic adaptor subunit [Roseisolibacter sp. H3M3-2]
MASDLRSARVRAEASRDAGRAALERARSYVGHLVGEGRAPAGADDHDVLVRSPIDGVVVGRDAAPGTVVLVGAPLVTVSRLGTLVLRIPVPERALAAATVGAPVRFEVPAWPGRAFDARVTRVSPTVDSLSRTVEVLASVDARGAALRAEMYASAELQGGGGARVLAVPAEVVQAMEGDTVVVAARRAGARGAALALEAVRVRVGRRTSAQAEILGGLAAGTPVVVRGAAVAKAELLKRRGG